MSRPYVLFKHDDFALFNHDDFALCNQSIISLFLNRFECLFFFDLEIWWRLQIQYCTLSQMTHWTTKFVIMIRCKINFNMIWYSVIFTATLIIWFQKLLWMFSFLLIKFLHLFNKRSLLQIPYFWETTCCRKLWLNENRIVFLKNFKNRISQYNLRIRNLWEMDNK